MSCLMLFPGCSPAIPEKLFFAHVKIVFFPKKMLEPVLFVKPVASLEDSEKKITFQDGDKEYVIDTTTSTTPRSDVLIPRSKSRLLQPHQQLTHSKSVFPTGICI